MEFPKRLQYRLYKIPRQLLRLMDDRSGFSRVIIPIATHRVPPGVGWWYVFGSATLVAVIPYWIEDTFMIFGPTTIALLLILLPFVANRGERSPSRRPWTIILVLLVAGLVGTLSIEGEKAPWSPNFEVAPLSDQVVRSLTGPALQGAMIFHDKGCHNCHTFEGSGGSRGPDLTDACNRLSSDQIVTRVLNGSRPNMPAYANNLSADELNALVAFLKSCKRQ